MSSVVYINSYLTIPIRNRIKKAIPYVAVCIGCLFILRGLGLEFLIFLRRYEFVYSRKSKLSLTFDLIDMKKHAISRAFLYIIKH
jgi:hypothetical protein